ncbi:hypothetical protein DFH29DRAFT_179292 [Suillus ampliporus]|nr:hypothetical protein DFH29DRAFT_179292 [Suillus ampliporus]
MFLWKAMILSHWVDIAGCVESTKLRNVMSAMFYWGGLSAILSPELVPTSTVTVIVLVGVPQINERMDRSRTDPDKL